VTPQDTSTMHGPFFQARPRHPVLLRLCGWSVVILAGVLKIWSRRFLVEFDGVNYLDVAQNLLRRDWHVAVNAYYSPLYSWLLAIPLSVLHSSLYWESTTLHLVNFAGYLASYGAYEFFVNEMLCRERTEAAAREGLAALPEAAWRCVGFALFLRCSLYMVDLGRSTPDIFVLAAVLLAAGLLQRMKSGETGWMAYAGLGLVLGLGYLAKAVMFPLTFVFMAVALFSCTAPRKAIWHSFLLLSGFLLVAGPWISILSRHEGRLSFGEAGRLSYLGFVDMGPPYFHFMVPEPDWLPVKHRMQVLSSHPSVVEFPKMDGVTYPPFYDVSYWLQGAKPYFNWTGQHRVLHSSFDTYMGFLDSQKDVLCFALFLIFLQGGFRAYVWRLAQEWALWLPGVVAMGLYALVLVEPRYIAPFVIPAWFGLLAAARIPSRQELQSWIRFSALAVLVATAVTIVPGALTDVYLLDRENNDQAWEVAQGLHQLGVPEGAAIAWLTPSADTPSPYWAHVARLHISAQVIIDQVDEYWSAPPDVQAKVRSLFTGTGAVAVVTTRMPAGVVLPGWTQIKTTPYQGSTPYYVSLLTTQSASRVSDKSSNSASIVAGCADLASGCP
jgi:4-amino-4-deoxy-L-arabinose transferase-like glycosyltransferase